MPDPIRNRIKAHVRVRAGDLVPHELNFRLHPELQRAALQALYQEALGLKLSDQVPGLAAFLRCGPDHHTVALIASDRPRFHHASFEVQDSEVQFVGHRWMRQRGHESIWGVGRHPKGSHVFDVWRDPSGFRFETFSDTDLCTASAETGLHSIAEAEMDLWSDRSVEAYFS